MPKVVVLCFVKVSSSVWIKRKSSSQYKSYLTCEMEVHRSMLHLRGSTWVRGGFLGDAGLNASRRHLYHIARAASDGCSWIGHSIEDDISFDHVRPQASM